MCPATDRKDMQTDGQCWSPKPLVRGTLGLIRLDSRLPILDELAIDAFDDELEGRT